MRNASAVAWYSQPLDGEDIFAGAFLIVFALVCAPLYAVVTMVMYRSDKDIVGFRFLTSAAIADMLLLFNYALWPGLTILFKSEIITPAMRHWVQMYLDWAWFSMCYHYMIIAWSRFAAIRFPNSFRTQSRKFSYGICACCYVASLIQVLCTHFQPWYVTFYYEPSAYGMLAEDFDKYLTQGQSFMFFTFHALMMVIPIAFYAWAIYLLIKHRKSAVAARRIASSSFKGQSNIETRLIFPCVFNSVVFIIGQVVITIGTGEGKWATWMVMLLFSANSAVNPLLLICFSAVIRKRVLESLGVTSRSDTHYFTVPVYRNSSSPSTPCHPKSNKPKRCHSEVLKVDSQFVSLSTPTLVHKTSTNV